MSGIAAVSVEPPVAAEPRVPDAGAPRQRLVRKYALLLIVLVGTALLLKSGVDFWFSYEESKAVLVRIQQEKAASAAQQIQEFLEEIQRQIGWTTHARWAQGTLEQRRQDYFRLLRQVPAITELSQLDAEGREQLKVSRLAMDVVGSGTDLSRSPAFVGAKAERNWFSPVYFRKHSEPYMTIAIARDGRNAGVTIAEINLKLIWDVVTGLKIGQGGYAYVVDNRGRLIAHPDISLVLRDTDLAGLPQVAAALPGAPGSKPAPDAVAVSKNIAGRDVLAAHAAITPPGWLVFLEVPLREALAPLYGAAWRTVLLLAIGLIAAAAVALLLARRMTGPIREIAAGAEQIGAGELGRRIEVHTGDELEGLAQQFNRMAADLQRSYAELESRVEQRTAELAEALDQQTATAEVLQVINASPGDLAPVFDAMLEKAMQLCGAAFGGLWTFDGDRYIATALRAVPPAYAEFLAANTMIPGPGSAPYRFLRGERSVIENVDLAAEENYRQGDRQRRALVDLGGARSAIQVPLCLEDRVLGVITLYRKEVNPFTEKQIALMQNFAAQAVIAMENARLITETREALEQQTATAEVLGVINASPGDLAPVFDAMLEKATRLCEADAGVFCSYDGECFLPAAWRGFDQFPPEPLRPHPETGIGRLARGENTVHILDCASGAAYDAADPARHAIVQLGGARSQLSAALRKDGTLLGTFTIWRREVRPFSDRQIALLQNFAAQAVIAMENARLITETQEALEQQTATAEVLQVINASPGDLAPVFDALLEKAMRLCGAAFGQLSTYDGKRFRTAATRGVPAGFAEYRRSNPPNYGPGTAPARVLAGERVIVIDDLQAEPAYAAGEPNRRALVDLGGARSDLLVALTKDEAVLGFIEIYRQEVRPFTDKQIALLENFAAQAVIAMENARLLEEIRQRQAELRVTFDNMVDGVAMFDAAMRLAAWNRNLQHLLELPDAFLGEPRSYADYIRFLAERGEFGPTDIDEELRRYAANAGQKSIIERTRPDGRVIEVRHNPVPDGGFVLIYSDITERKRAELQISAARDAAETALSELQTAQAKLIHAEKMASLGQLTAGIAHEIKNPLNFVNNFAGLSIELLDELKETAGPSFAALGEEARVEIDETIEMLTSNLDKIAEHGRRADGIVKSMLAHSRGSSGERQVMELNALVDEALNLAYHGARAQDPNFNITLERDFAAGLPPIELVPQDLMRVFLNLIGNGFHAAHQRQSSGEAGFRPVLRIATHDLGDAVEIRVRDNGTGIRPEHRDKLFQPFFTTKPTGQGTGLGLSISYDIVTQQHGGTISVDSEFGAFTEFTVRLPRAAQRPTARRAG